MLPLIMMIGLWLACASAHADDNAPSPRLLIQRGHEAAITAVALSDDARLAASGDAAGELLVWQVASGRILIRARASGAVEAVALVDGQLVARSGGALRAWDLRAGSEGPAPGSVVFPAAPEARPAGVGEAQLAALSGDGRRMVVALDSGGLAVVDPDGGRGLFRLEGRAEGVSDVAWGEAGPSVLTDAGRLVSWDADAGQPVAQVDLAVKDAATLRWTEQESAVLVGREEGPAQLQEVRTGAVLHRFSGHDGAVTSVVVSPSGKLALSGAADGSAMIWNLSAGSLLRELPAHDGPIGAVAWSAEGQLVATAAEQVRLLDGRNGLLRGELTGHTGGVTAMAFGPRGQLLLTGDAAGVLRAWSVQDGALRWEQDLGAPVDAVAWMPKGHRLLVSKGGVVELRAKKGGDLVEEITRAPARVGHLRMSEERGLLYLGDSEGQVRALKLDDWTLAWEVEAHKGPITGLDVHPDGQRVVSMSEAGGVRYWSARRGKSKGRGARQPVSVGALARTGEVMVLGRENGSLGVWAGEGREYVARLDGDRGPAPLALDGAERWMTAGVDGRVRVWDAQTRTMLYDLREHDGPVRALAQSPDGARMASGGADGALLLWPSDRPIDLRELDGFDASVTSLRFSADGQSLFAASETGELRWIDATTGATRASLETSGAPLVGLALSADGRRLAASERAGATRLFDAGTGALLATLEDARASGALAFSPDGAHLLTSRVDGGVDLWSVGEARRLSTLVLVAGGGWLVVDESGRFDLDASGAEGAHWVLDGEVIALEQLRARYYDPGLMAKALGLAAEPLLEVLPLAALEMFPEVIVREPQGGETRLFIELVNRGGGIGEVLVTLNGSDISAALERPSADPSVDRLELSVDLAELPYYQPSGQNRVEVQAFNASGYLSSRGASTAFMDEMLGEDDGPPPHFWAVIIGTHDYKGDALDLRYPAKDAQSMATALRIASEQLFGPENTHVTLLTTAEGDARPTIEAIEQAFGQLAQAQPQDLVLIYLAGHGLTFDPGGGADYYYLTPEFGAFEEIEDPSVRDTRTLSGTRMQELLLESPAGKRVLILDTCHSGALVDTLDAGASRAAPPGQARALERMKDRTGTYVLAGAAADAVSYETTRYGQGVLTYALLEGMRGAALDGNSVNVASLFHHARDRVPELAEGIGGIQRPVLKEPGSGSFDIGLVDSEHREDIPLQAERPVIVRTSFFALGDVINDSLGLSQAVDLRLRDQSYEPESPMAFFNTDSYPDAYRLSGQYVIGAVGVTLTANLAQGEDIVAGFRIEGESVEDTELLAAPLVWAINDWFMSKDPESLYGTEIGQVEILSPEGALDAAAQMEGDPAAELPKAIRWLTREGPCLDPTDRSDLSMALGTARLSYNRGNLGRFTDALQDAEAALDCMSEPLTAEDIAALHRVEGLAIWAEGATVAAIPYLAMSRPTAAEFTLAKEGGPEDEYDVLVANRTLLLTFRPEPVAELAPAARGRVALNGQVHDRSLLEDTPYVLQRSTARRVLQTTYVHPGEPIPRYPQLRRVLLGVGVAGLSVSAGSLYGAWAVDRQLQDDPDLPNRIQADCSGWGDPGFECFEPMSQAQAEQRQALNHALVVSGATSAVVGVGALGGLGLSFVW